jgi:HEAT repeat protein
MSSFSAAVLQCFILFCIFQDERTRHIEQLIEQLRSARLEERDEASRKLKQIGAEALPLLEKATSDKDSEVAARARILLRFLRINSELSPQIRAAIPDAVERLASGDPEAWTRVFFQVIRLKSKGRLQSIANGDVEYLVPKALRGAQAIGDQLELCKVVSVESYRTAIPELTQFMKSDNEAVREQSSLALQALEAQEAIAELTSLTSDSKATARAWAAKTLSRLGAKNAIPSLLPLLNDSVPSVKVEVIKALEALDGKTSIARLHDLLLDEDGGVRAAAVSALATFQANSEASAIAERLRDKSPAVRAAAVVSLALLRSTERIPEIAELLKDGNGDVRVKTAASLAMLGSQEYVPHIVKLLKDKDPNVREQVGIVLDSLDSYDALSGAHCREAALPALAQLLKDDEVGVRGKAVEILGNLGATSLTQSLRQMLQDKDASVRIAAANSLCWLSDRDGVVALLKMAQENPSVGLNSLNAYRTPEAWHRLRTTRMYIPQGFSQSNLRKLVHKYGWTLNTETEIVLVGVRDTTLLGLLDHTPQGDQPSSFILEEKEIKLVTRDDALKYWATWWKANSREK